MTVRLLHADLRLDDPGEDVLASYLRHGEACPDRIAGDFAFALEDEGTGRVFAARDPLGAKPLAYRVVGETIHVAASARALARAGGIPATLDETRVADALVPELEGADRTSTFFREIRRLPPGHRLVFEQGRVTTSPYWTLDPLREIVPRDEAAAVEAFREIFGRAVRTRLTDDAGSMLSGGLDSSAIVGFGRRPLVTFSALRDDPRCEESRHVRSMLALPGIDATTFRPEDLDAYRPEIDRFLDTMEEPFDGTLGIPLLCYAAARRRGLRAVLDGVDGDAVVSLEPGLLDPMLRGLRWTTALREARGLARFYGDSYPPWSSATRLLAESARRAFTPRAARDAWRGLRRPARVEAALSGTLIRREFAERIGIGERLEAAWERAGPAVVHANLAAAVERYARVAASQGIEARHPFLDRRLVEFCSALPADFRVRDGWSKWILRRASEGFLPDEVRWRRGRWVRLGPDFLTALIQSKRKWMLDSLDEARGDLEPFLDPEALARASPAGEAVWQAAILGKWLHSAKRIVYDPAAAVVTADKSGGGVGSP